MAPSDPSVLLRARRLAVRIGARTVCTDLSLALAAGESWAVLGPSGRGKTTLLLTLAGLRRPLAGDIELAGRPLHTVDPRERARALGIVFQDAVDPFPASVFEEVLSGRHPHLGPFAWEGPADDALARAALRQVDLEGFETRELSTLSGGERQRVALAALLAQDPALSLLDEPVGHLDLRHQVAILQCFAERARRPGHANVLVLHDVNLARRFCTHALLLMPDGSAELGAVADVLVAGTLSRLYGHPVRAVDDVGWPVFVPA